MRQRATTSTIPAFSPQRTYRYGYDSLSRLTRACYSDSEGGAGRYDTRYSYDLNGNLTSLVRRGALSLSSAGTPSAYGAIDSLTLEYAGNRLRSVSDAAAGPHYQGAFHFVDGADEDEEYRYDLNGNTVTDLNRGILLSRFDTAGHPARMDFADGSSTCWLYDDAGTKLRTLHRVASVPVAVPGSQGPALTETVTDYSAGFVYEDSLLTRINLDGAYLSYTGADGSRLSTPEYHFYLRDHLGNNRVDVAADGSICQVTDYYPYGLPMASSRNAAAQRWLFGGKELDRISGLDLYDFEARAYDPALARFTSPDRLQEKKTFISPYLYCRSNPIMFVDPTGLDEWEIDKNGNIINHIQTEEYDALYIVDSEGKRIQGQSQTFEYGTISALPSDESGGNTIFRVNEQNPNENTNGTKVFELFANCNTVEWAYWDIKENGERSGYVSTSHEKGADGSGDFVFRNILSSGSVSLLSHTHNHPAGNMWPSNEFIDSNGIRRQGDTSFAQRIIAESRQSPLFYIYTFNSDSSIKKYTDYDPDSKEEDFIQEIGNGQGVTTIAPYPPSK